jgi:hypothetical protein
MTKPETSRIDSQKPREPDNCVRCGVTTEDKDGRGVCVFCLHDEQVCTECSEPFAHFVGMNQRTVTICGPCVDRIHTW